MRLFPWMHILDENARGTPIPLQTLCLLIYHLGFMPLGRWSWGPPGGESTMLTHYPWTEGTESHSRQQSQGWEATLLITPRTLGRGLSPGEAMHLLGSHVMLGLRRYPSEGLRSNGPSDFLCCFSLTPHLSPRQIIETRIPLPRQVIDQNPRIPFS